MPFGLHGASAKFQGYINKTLQNYLDIFVSAYMNDILIYNNTLKKHKQHVYQVLKQLWDANLQINIAKCEFHKEKVLYLSLIVGRNEVHMNPKKVTIIQLWLHPQNKKDVQSFFKFTNFYHWFIWRFSEIATPLTTLMSAKFT